MINNTSTNDLVEQMTKLLNDGRTDLLDRLFLQEQGENLNFLILKDDKTIGFEFVSKAKN